MACEGRAGAPGRRLRVYLVSPSRLAIKVGQFPATSCLGRMTAGAVGPGQ